MPSLLQIFSQSDYLIKILDFNSHTEWQTVHVFRSQLIWNYTVCKDSVCPGSARPGLNQSIDIFIFLHKKKQNKTKHTLWLLIRSTSPTTSNEHQQQSCFYLS